MIYIITPLYNRVKDTINFISKCRAQTNKSFRLIFIDDGSQDCTYEVLQGNEPWVTVLKGDGQYWWTKSINVGVTRALQTCDDDDYIMTMNNDVEFDPDFIENILQFAAKYPGCIFNPVSIENKQKKFATYTGAIRKFTKINWNYHPLAGSEIGENQKDVEVEVQYLYGRGTTFPVSVFKEIGRYDEMRFPHYGADEEFTFRAGQLGYKLYITTSAKVYVDEKTTGLNPQDVKMTLKDKIESFTSIKSCQNMDLLVNKTFLMAPKYWRIPFFVCTVLKALIWTFIVNDIRFRGKA